LAKWILNRPDGGHFSDIRGIGIQDTRAIHLPDRQIARRVPPQNVAMPVPIEVADSNNCPGSDRDISDIRGSGIQDTRAVHFPNHHIAAAVAPENVALAVAVEVPRSDNRPNDGGYISDKRGSGIQDT